MSFRKHIVVVGTNRQLVLQVLLSIHTFTNAVCIAICTPSVRYLRLSNMSSRNISMAFDGNDDQLFVDTVNSWAAAVGEVIVIPADCKGTRMVNRVRSRLQARIPPTPDDAMLDLFDNKWHFYLFCKEIGLNVPETQFIGAKQNLAFSAVAAQIGLPFILKPLDQQGSLGVRLISDERDYVVNILGDRTYQFAPLLAQRYIRGVDIGMNLFSVEGKVRSIAMQQRAYPQNEEAKITFCHNSYLEKVAHAMCEASQYDGVMNVDARIEEHTGTVYLFESNPRFWVSLSASAWCGLNFLAENLECSHRDSGMKRLASGEANMFYHPLFRPSLWPYFLFDRGAQGRMARLMAYDLCTLGSQIRTAMIKGMKKNCPPGVPAPRSHGWRKKDLRHDPS